MVLDILRPCTKILFGKKQKYNPTSGNCKKKKMAEEQYTLTIFLASFLTRVF